jgi:deoxyadenosine/deoxycytidine kinase
MKISIEGNIGCGKSSLLSRLCLETRTPVFLEPVDEWKQWLSLFYTDPARWGMSFNINVLLTFNQWKNNNFLALYERSPISNRYIFAQLQYDQKRMNDMELEMFNRIYNQLSWLPDVVIYIRTDPAVSMKRMQQRARECENEVPLDYIEAVHQKYEDIFNSKEHNPGCKVVVVDGNRTHDEVYADVLNILKTVQA